MDPDENLRQQQALTLEIATEADPAKCRELRQKRADFRHHLREWLANGGFPPRACAAAS